MTSTALKMFVVTHALDTICSDILNFEYASEISFVPCHLRLGL